MDEFDIDPLVGEPPDDDLPERLERVRRRTNALGLSAGKFSSAMTKAFTDATVGGKQFDDVLKSMAVKLSGMAVSQAFKPVAKGITTELSKLLGGTWGASASGRGGGEGGFGSGLAMPMSGPCNCCCGEKPNEDIGQDGLFAMLLQMLFRSPRMTPFASGGVINTPGYFPLMSGELGLAGEAGPEAIMPLRRGSDGRLGVAMSGGAPANVTVHIATPDADSFRRSEAYVTGQIARAVARGQRSL